MFFVKNKSQKVYPTSECETEHSDTDTDTDNSEEDFILFTILRIINKYFNSNSKSQIIKMNDPLGMSYSFKTDKNIDGIISTHYSHDMNVWEPQIIKETQDLGWFLFVKK